MVLEETDLLLRSLPDLADLLLTLRKKCLLHLGLGAVLQELPAAGADHAVLDQKPLMLHDQLAVKLPGNVVLADFLPQGADGKRLLARVEGRQRRSADDPEGLQCLRMNLELLAEFPPLLLRREAARLDVTPDRRGSPRDGLGGFPDGQRFHGETLPAGKR